MAGGYYTTPVNNTLEKLFVKKAMPQAQFKAQCASMQKLPYPDFLKPMSESPASLALPLRHQIPAAMSSPAMPSLVGSYNICYLYPHLFFENRGCWRRQQAAHHCYRWRRHLRSPGRELRAACRGLADTFSLHSSPPVPPRFVPVSQCPACRHGCHAERPSCQVSRRSGVPIGGLIPTAARALRRPYSALQLALDHIDSST